MTTKILQRWDPNGRYKFGCGSGWYLDGTRRIYDRKGEYKEKPIDVDKYRRIMEETTEFMVSRLDEAGETAPFFIIDDHSPVELDMERLADIVDPHPFFGIRLPKNMGAGGKENILQHLLSRRVDYILRWDADVKLDTLDLGELEAAFEDMEDAFAITSCITYFARLDASTHDKRYFAGSNIADFVAYRSEALERLGYSDPELRLNEDGDLRLRALAAHDWKCYTDREITGKAVPSGAGNASDDRSPIGEYIRDTRPFIKVVFPKNGNFRLLLNKTRPDYIDEAKDFYIGAHPIAKKLAEKLWR